MSDPVSRLSNWPQITERIKAISNDNRSGAAEILSHSAETLALVQEECSADPTISAEDALDLVRAVSAGLTAGQPDMAPLLNMVRKMRSEVLLPAENAQAVFQQAARSAADFARSAEQFAQEAAWQLAGLIQANSTVLTHSRSSTVLLGLKRAKESGKSFSAIVTESRPVMEGRSVAKSLVQAGIPVTLIADAAAALVMGKVDLIVIGADRVTETHIVNKIGSYMIALAAREHNVPLYSIADSSKFISESELSEREETSRSPGELYPLCPPGITILNQYFEQVPLEVVTGLVNQGGLHPVATIPLLVSSAMSALE